MSSETAVLRDLIIKTLDGDWGNDEPKEGFVPYRVIRGGDFPDVELGEVEKVPRCYLKESTVNRRTLQAGDLLIETAGGTKDRPTGRVLYISQEILEKFDLPVTCASFARFIRLDDERVNQKYIFWYLRSMYQKGEMWQHQVQHTGVARFQWTSFADSQVIELFARESQDRLVEALDSLHNKIVLNRQINQTIEQIAQAIFKSWFVDFDPVKAKIRAKTSLTQALSQRERALKDPVERAAMCAISSKSEAELDQLPSETLEQLAVTAALFPDELVESKLGLIPKGWDIKEIGNLADVVDCLHSKKPQKVEENSGNILLQLNNISNDGLLSLDDFYFISDEDYKKWISRIEAQEGDCIITNVGRVGAVAQIPKSLRAALGRNMTDIRCKKNSCYPTFLITLLTSPYIRGEIKRRTDVGTILNALNVRNIPRLRFVYPMAKMLREFEARVLPLQKKREINIEENLYLKHIRDTLLPKLLSGEIELKETKLTSEVGA